MKAASFCLEATAHSTCREQITQKKALFHWFSHANIARYSERSLNFVLIAKDLAPYEIGFKNDGSHAARNLEAHYPCGLFGLGMRSSLERDLAPSRACALGGRFPCFRRLTASMRLRIERRGMPLSE